ncbi:hypothetical protein F511_24386 [Dorcoceras hygrometricum]|uniref:UDP-glycosyltransferase 83A1-like n=1 Tax=Dorcoceras hygrometricum TaxID=472368 RepID=A0A2Z7BDH2_9LAMI|nr:hypothetical protein F511_24386 [Dorcoceras hygrometricum]
MNPEVQNIHQNEGHILVVSCPLQGHAAPLIKISHQLTKFGIKVTFLTTNLTHLRTAPATARWEDCRNKGIRVVAVPDGLEHEEDNKDPKKLHDSMNKVMPVYLEDLLKKTNQGNGNTDRISGVIIDSPMGWMTEIPKKLGLKVAIFWCSNPGCLALGLKIPQLIEAKLIEKDGTPLKYDQKINLLHNMPAMAINEFTWYFPRDENTQKEIFHVVKGIIHNMKNADWILCNWIQEFDPTACNLLPNLLPIGPLLAKGRCAGSFFPEDSTCLEWLDKQPENSTVYVAFGSTSKFTQQQVDELANGLEMMNRPFLWVAWSGLTHEAYPFYNDKYLKRVGNRGKIVEWAPQEAVLGHPSIACFVTHCGWSSFMESPNEEGIVSRNEIKETVEEVLSNLIIKENVLNLKEIARNTINEGGSSFANLEYLVKQMR